MRLYTIFYCILLHVDDVEWGWMIYWCWKHINTVIGFKYMSFQVNDSEICTVFHIGVTLLWETRFWRSQIVFIWIYQIMQEACGIVLFSFWLAQESQNSLRGVILLDICKITEQHAGYIINTFFYLMFFPNSIGLPCRHWGYEH